MPHVPRYDNPTVPIGPVAIPQAAPAGAETFGAGLARGLGSLSRDVLQIAAEQREKGQITALNNAKIGYLQESGKALDGGPDANGTVQPGLANMTGADADGLEAKYKPLHDRIVQDRLDGLADYPEAREQFRRWTEERYLSDATRLNRQQFEQNTKTALATATAMQKTSIDKAVQDYRQTGAYSESDALRATHDLANLSGVPEAVRNRMVAETVSGIDRRIVEAGLNSGKPKAAGDAADFYDAVRHELTTADLSALQGLVSAYRDQEAGARLGNDVYAAAMQGVTVNDAPPYQEMIARIDAEDGTDGRRKMAKAVIEDKLREYERDKRQNQESLARTVQGAPSYAEAVKLIQQAEGAVGDAARGNILDDLDRR